MVEGTPRNRARDRAYVAALALLTAGSIAAAANAALGSSPRADAADLSVRAVSAKGSQAYAGGLIRVTATVVNKGERHGRPTLLGYYLSLDRKVGRQDIRLRPAVRLRALGPGGRVRHSGPLRIPTTVAQRRFRLLVCADASRRLAEASERNNCRATAKALTVTRPGPGNPIQPGGSPPSPGPAGEPAPGPAPPEEEPAPPDETAPTPAFTEPAEGAQTNDSTPLIAGQAGTDPNDSGTVTVEIHAGAIGLGPPVESVTAARAQDGTWSLQSPHLNDGRYVAVAEQTDAAGNVGTSAPRSFTIDTAAPAVTLNTPAAARSNDSTPTFEGSAGDEPGDSGTVTVKLWSGTGTSGNPSHTFTTSRSGASWSTTQSVTDGTYTARAEQADAAGNTGLSATRTFTVDTAPPGVSLSGPPAGASNDGTPTFTGSAGNAEADAATITVKVWSGTGTSGNPSHTFTTSRSGASWSTTQALQDGTYTARAEQADSAGNTGVSAARTFTIDTDPPDVGITSPGAGAVLTDSTPTVSGPAGDSTGDASTVRVRIYEGTGTAGPLRQDHTVTRSGSTWSVDAGALSDGTYTVRADQVDSAGNSASATRTFSIDALGPAVRLDNPADGSSTNDPTPTFDGSAGDAAGDSSTVTVKIYPGTAASGSPVQTLTATRNGSGWSIDATTLGDGTYTGRAEQSDSAGHTGLSAPHTFTVDTAPPGVTLTSPAEGHSNDATPTLSGSAGNAAGDSSTVTVRIWQGAATTGTPIRTLSISRSVGSWSVTADSLADGTYTARADQTDAAGNTGQSAARTFTIDTVAPAVTLTNPADLSSGADDTPALQGTSSDSGQVTVRIHSGNSTAGALVQTRTATVSNGSWSVDALALTEGTYTAQAEQSDAAGNTGMSGAHRFSVPATLLAVGDISVCGNDHDEATATLADTRPGTVATLGDNVYEQGTAAEFNGCYHPTWGRHKARTKPSAGNHEYEDPAGNAAGYFGYFGAAAGDPDKGYYSYDLGNWHVVVLNSSDNCVTIGCGPTSPQVQWLRADLDAHPASCTLAYWHHPRFTSELPDATNVQAFWDVLYEKNADLILNGHAHNYERYKPQTPTGAVDTERGIRELIVGTGGRSLRPIATQDANSEVAQWSTFGILEVTLGASSYSWKFVPVAGGTFTDSGTTPCH